MTTDTAYAHTSHQRRARTVYRTVAKKRPVTGLLAAELAALACFALAAAGFISLRAWLFLPN
ncbi:hypothetical protein FG93_01654 [Bosea sp. LC85]|uniref:hypothetical protein n=1 Tax=Bosea sp. LC85 TaxID=1502851 RepID=UPI0004E422EF|nr:hypothetical protein [Bosea sp. LC85]KFC73963.1 hypothetical protein FG93_01654 [Bosea sp. LC85]